MRKKYFLLLLFPALTLAQWLPEVRLTNDSAISVLCYNNGRCMIPSGDTLHLVFYGELYEPGNKEIVYKKSTNGGISWSNNVRLTDAADPSEDPTIAVSGLNVHVTWYDSRDGNQEIYYKRSTDGGLNWDEETRLTNNPGISGRPNIILSGSILHIVWGDIRNEDRELYYRRSLNNGNTWEPEVRLTNNTGDSRSGSISLSGNYIHLTWFDTEPGNEEIYYKRSTNGGNSWGNDMRLTDNTFASQFGSLGSSGSVVHIIWHEARDGNFEIYYKRSADDGNTWGSDIRLTNAPYNSLYPAITVSGQVVHVTWYDARDGNTEIYYKRSTDGGITWENDIRITNDEANSTKPNLTTSGEKLHLVWIDDRDGNTEIYYKRNPTGNPIAIKNISSEIPENFSLSRNFPNPFNPVTKIQFEIPQFYKGQKHGGSVKLNIYNSLGQHVETLVDQQLSPGAYEVEWNASGSGTPSGVYFYTLQAGEFTNTKKMILIK